MPELDIEASAREVAALLNPRQIRQASERLDALRDGQSLVVQEALDRMIATNAREELVALALPGVLPAQNAGDTGPMLERLRAATGAPRFPDVTETRNLSQAQLHDVYGSMAGTRGDQSARDSLDRNNERVILGLRRETNTTHADGKGDYDDRLVVVWKDNDGTRHAREFNQANTEPSAQYDHHAGSNGNRRYAEGGTALRLAGSPGFEDVRQRKIEGEDVNRDGIRDLGRLSQGTTEMLATTHPTYEAGRQTGTEFSLRPSAAAVAAGAGRVQRDTNGDGWFTAADVNGVQDLNNTFKIHRGSGLNTDSAGCQTIGGGEYDAFIAEVQGNPQQNRWQYVLTSVYAGRQPFQEPAMQNEGQPPAPAALPPPPLPHPAHPGHPDQGLHRQIRDRIGMLGPDFNEHAERLSLSLLAEAKSQGLSQVDHLFASQATSNLKPGEHLFLVQGRPNDPASPRAMVNAASAMATPTEESLIRIERINHTLSNTASVDPRQHQHTSDTLGIRLG